MKTCVICGNEYDGYGNNPEPVMPCEAGKCCDSCNMGVVVPIRLGAVFKRLHEEAFPNADQ